jgi:ferredoxin
MPTITVNLEEGDRTIEVEHGVKLVLALEDAGIDISHRCGGNAKCTTCGCEVSAGEPAKKTQAEIDKGFDKGRLSCQILVENDMTVKPLMRVSKMDWDAPGSRPKDNITPEPAWNM